MALNRNNQRPGSPGVAEAIKTFGRIRPGGRSQLENAPSNMGNCIARGGRAKPAGGSIFTRNCTAAVFNTIARIP